MLGQVWWPRKIGFECGWVHRRVVDLYLLMLVKGYHVGSSMLARLI